MTESTSRASIRALVFALFFGSGATALVYQVAWARGLTLVFGASHEAVGVVLAAFMGGLALGGFVFGRLGEGCRRPLRVYGLLELGIAVVASLLPWLLDLVDGFYVARAREAGDITLGLHLTRVGLAGGLLLLPTFLMGGTLPVLARLLVAGREQFGLRLSQLYGVNTTGAVVGALGAGFFLLPALGVRATEFTAVGVNLVIAVAALVADRRLAPVEAEAAAPEVTPDVTPDVAEGAALSRAALRLAFLGTAVSGLCALALEVMWMRTLSVVVGTTTYSFTVMLAAFLVGIALGSWIHAALPLRRLGTALHFGLVLSAVGLLALVFAQAGPWLPQLAEQLDAVLYPESAGLQLGTALVASFALMLLPCVLMGIAFPLAAEAGAELHARVGRSVGDVVALNTVGAIVGSVLAGFVLVPHLGLQRGMLWVAVLDLAYGLVVVGLALASARARPGRLLLGAAVVVAATVALPFVLPAWDVRVFGTYLNNVRGHLAADDEGGEGRETPAVDVLYYREGRSSIVSVIESGPHRAILIDGKSVASDSLSDMQHELLLGHLPVLLHQAPRTVAVVGLGAGITLGSVLAHPEVERVVLVEIEPAVLDGARAFAHVNGGAVDDPRLHVVFQDGRNHLRTTSETFDVITADPIHPWARGASYLYTAEYYAVARQRLNPGGIMCQWLPLYELSGENVRSVIATFNDSFPHATLWQTAYDAVLIGSEAPLAIDPELERRMQEPAVARQLDAAGIGDPASLLLELTLDGGGMDVVSVGAPRNTDDNLYLEFSSPLSVGTPEVRDNVLLFNEHRVDVSTVLPEASAGLDGASWRAAKSATVEVQIAMQRAKLAGSPEAYAPVIERLEAVCAGAPGYGRPRSMLAQALTEQALLLLGAGAGQEGVDALVRAVEVWPAHGEARHQLAIALARLGRPELALESFAAALALRPGDARILGHQGAALLRAGRVSEALPPLERAAGLRPRDAEVQHNLGIARLEAGDEQAAESAFAAALALDPRLPGLHNAYAVLLRGVGRHDEARRTLEQGLEAQPGDLHLQRQLAWVLATAPQEALRDGPRALTLAQAVDAATGGAIPEVVDTVAAALAEVGRFQEAAARAEAARRLARDNRQVELADRIAARVATYRAERAFREP